ncbi:hypothetical protein TW65_07501 [Stemphylium lycopersici]|uniref:TPR-like protein n=1 Tax=Stemphylium lycopersici TaxID=183478 RepID=A0A364NDA4_STELY|nr:hypothetical protein TW65_07501 [Stemphylium lycopersici]RAR15298.1 TPR-like protein [Stemphylium lycopersici]
MVLSHWPPINAKTRSGKVRFAQIGWSPYAFCVMAIIEIAESALPSPQNAKATVDIVAVHGLDEDGHQTWTDTISRILWLRDLLPQRLHHFRALIYNYKAETFTSPGIGSTNSTLAYANNLVAELCADRQLCNAFDRPIVFICHGFGGLLVKRALSYSSSREGKAVEHLRSIYTCTYGILFLATPHNGFNKTGLLSQSSHAQGPSHFTLSLLKGSEMLNEVNEQFAPLMKHFAIYNFWEEVETQNGHITSFIVDYDSAAPPAWDNVERCGITATHSEMTKFASHADRRFQPVLEALSRYIRQAPALIASRWRTNIEVLHQKRQHEVDELLRPRGQPFQVDTCPEHNEWCLIPRKSSSYFTGRQKHTINVKKMFGTVEKRTNYGMPKVLVIYGLGGSGKTQFCLKYAEDNKQRYWAVFWVDASSQENVESGFAFIGAQVGRGSTMASALHWLSHCKQPWLLILDNADDLDMDLSSCYPSEGNGHIIVTTRNPNAIEYATVGHLRFCGMEPEEAISLLLKAAYPDPHHQSQPAGSKKWQLAQGIAIELGYLPLAIAHAGATIRRNIYTLERYLKYYLSQRKSTLSYTRLKSVDEINIIATWEIPFRKIATRESVEHKDAVDLMHTFAFMHHETIPERIFQRSWDNLRSATSAVVEPPDILQSVWSEGVQARFRRAISVLCDHSIVEYESSKGLCTMHPVLRKTETLESASEIERFAWVYAEQGQWKTARQLQESVIRARRRILGKRHTDTIRAQRSYAQTLWNLFEIKAAIDVQRQILDALRWHRQSVHEWLVWPIWKPIHVPYCLALNDITLTLWLAGERRISKMTGERAVDGLKIRLGPEDPQTLSAMFNLARTYFHLGEVHKSRELLVWVLRLQKRFFGMSHPETLMTRNELGMLLCASKRHLFAAQRLVENVLKARQKILGEEHAYTLWSVNDLSKIHIALGRPEKAVAILESILPVVKRTLGDDHVGAAMTQSNLAKAYFASGRWKEAEELVQRLLARIPPDHPDWIHNMYGYAHVKFKLGKIKEAEGYCVEIMDRATRIKGLFLLRDDPGILSTAELLGSIYHSQGRETELMDLQRKFPTIELGEDDDDRFDPYAVRRASDQSPHSHQSVAATAQRQTKSSSWLEIHEPFPKPVVRRTF